MRVCGNELRDEAANWLASLPAGDEPSIAQMAQAYIGGTAGAVASVAKLLTITQFRR